jgi:hypothetical protein
MARDGPKRPRPGERQAAPIVGGASGVICRSSLQNVAYAGLPHGPGLLPPLVNKTLSRSLAAALISEAEKAVFSAKAVISDRRTRQEEFLTNVPLI